MKSIILVHPAGIGDAIEDFILIKSILNQNENIKIHYIGNHFINDLLALINIKKFDTTIIEKRGYFGFKDTLKFKNIKALLKTPKYYDLVYVMPGINLKKAREVIKFLSLEKLAYEYAGNLSGGQKKLLELGRTMMVDAKLVLLDEVGAGVNRTLLKDLGTAIEKLNKEYVLFWEFDARVRGCREAVEDSTGCSD